MDYQAVLFDFDYTLGDATDVIVEGFQFAFRKMGLPQPDRESVRQTIGYRLEDSYTMLTDDSDPANQEKFCDLYRAQANPRQITGTRLFPGAAELLSSLHNAGIRTGLVSTKRTDTLNRVASHCGISHLLDLVSGGDLVTRNKPDPEGLNQSLVRLRLRPECVLYCGDTILDAGAAQGAGVDFCAVLNGTTTEDAFKGFPCRHIAPDLHELRSWLGLPNCTVKPLV